MIILDAFIIEELETVVDSVTNMDCCKIRKAMLLVHLICASFWIDLKYPSADFAQLFLLLQKICSALEGIKSTVKSALF